MIRGTKDFWAGLIYVFFGASAIIIARDYAMGTAIKMGPAYFPSLLGGVLVAIGVVSMVRSFIVLGSPVGAFAVKSLSLIVLAVLVFGVLVRVLGMAISLPLLVLISAYGSIHFRWAPTLVLALGLTVGCIFVFLEGLGIPLPIWGTWLGG